uniref:Uncharacterized protein n=1 Tax=Arundo donax TaxID=35708 RepID=A0A0A9CAX2_ARUDO
MGTAKPRCFIGAPKPGFNRE